MMAEFQPPVPRSAHRKWTKVTIRRETNLIDLRPMHRWLDEDDQPGSFYYDLSKHTTKAFSFFISDPNVAFAFKMRFG